ncbi:YifB family Mg chelatase-like AAA ATPase [Candidatus Poribacteria bacterium]|nr:YifB family Mg chelatase-like AAA ATPase [Candidatus Poribacteria bacterium]
MLSVTLSGALFGLDAYIVKVEVDVSDGLPSFNIVGLPDTAVRESKERVTAAIRNSGFKFPAKRITVNLAPADIRKEGSAFDLPIAIALLAAAGHISLQRERLLLLGELSLDGTVRPVKGALPITLGARKAGLDGVIVPPENGLEAAVVEGMNVYQVKTLSEAAAFLSGEVEISTVQYDVREAFRKGAAYNVDFSDVKGQEHVKRALEVAAAGGHNVVMIGPPGSGKTMLARRLPTILPDMTLEEALETTKIHSIAGLLSPDTPIISTRPFRSPHHTVSNAGLIGGGTYPRPGEVSLAHNGVLFLDELPEFRRDVLEVLRQPLEEGTVTISRAAATVSYPANFMLICAMNPCPCGYFGDPNHRCRCTPTQIQHYISRISGPLLDRIDIHVEVPAVRYRELASERKGESSQAIKERVQTARQIQRERFKGTRIRCNADMSSRDIRRYCAVDERSQELLRIAITQLGLSARAYDRVLKVSRTIADLEGSERIKPEHVSEAIQYRGLDRQYWA